MDNFLAAIGAIIMAILIMVLASFIGGFFVMIFWNWVIPTIFGLTTITYVQAVVLNLLCGCLFKSVTTNNSKSK